MTPFMLYDPKNLKFYKCLFIWVDIVPKFRFKVIENAIRNDTKKELT